MAHHYSHNLSPNPHPSFQTSSVSLHRQNIFKVKSLLQLFSEFSYVDLNEAKELQIIWDIE